VFPEEPYNGIPNVTVWRVLRKRLHLKAYKLSIVHHLEQWIVCTLLSVNIIVTLATQQHLEYLCKALFKILSIANSMTHGNLSRLYVYISHALVLGVPGYRSRSPGSIRSATRFSEK
jgi:hypothetical protein